ncbi:MAG: urease accessory protein UreF [Microcystaceae cyanobacterium]
MFNPSLLHLLQLVSPSLPVGAYSYSEGLETLVEREIIKDSHTLKQWLLHELMFGTIHIESAIMVRGHNATLNNNLDLLNQWNQWLSAARETQELRQQSWQMGQSLQGLLIALDSQFSPILQHIEPPCNYAIALSIAFAIWEIELSDAILAHLWGWMTNLVSASIRLIPLGQTEGQQIIVGLNNSLQDTAKSILDLKDEDLFSCSWGLSLASMNHETLYTRLFRS